MAEVELWEPMNFYKIISTETNPKSRRQARTWPQFTIIVHLFLITTDHALVAFDDEYSLKGWHSSCRFNRRITLEICFSLTSHIVSVAGE